MLYPFASIWRPGSENSSNINKVFISRFLENKTLLRMNRRPSSCFHTSVCIAKGRGSYVTVSEKAWVSKERLTNENQTDRFFFRKLTGWVSFWILIAGRGEQEGLVDSGWLKRGFFELSTFWIFQYLGFLSSKSTLCLDFSLTVFLFSDFVILKTFQFL